MSDSNYQLLLRHMHMHDFNEMFDSAKDLF